MRLENTTLDAQYLFNEILNDYNEYPVAALAKYFKNEKGWDELYNNDLIEMWQDDAGQEFVAPTPETFQS